MPSIASNVPVKQIVVDPQWYAILITITVDLTETAQGDNTDIQKLLDIQSEDERRY